MVIQPSLVQMMACRLVGAKPLSEPMLKNCQLDPKEQNSVKIQSKFIHFHSRKCIWICRLENGSHFVSAANYFYSTGTRTIIWSPQLAVNILRQRQNYSHFAEGIFKWICLNENVWIALQVALKFVPKVWTNNMPALVQIMDQATSHYLNQWWLDYWRPQWVKTLHQGNIAAILQTAFSNAFLG